MKKIIYSVVIIFTLITTIVFYSCNKTNHNQLKEDKNFVPLRLAIDLAKNIPQKFDSLNKQTRSSRTVLNTITIKDEQNNPALYVINFTNKQGFVVISADYRYEPLCANIEIGNMETDTVPSMLVNWFEVTINNISALRTGLYDNGNIGYLSWINFVNNINPDLNEEVSKIKPNALPLGGGNGDPCGNSYSYTKGPLLPCTWGQGCTYNEDCPQMGCTIGCWGSEAWTGCVATSISQILRKHSKVSIANYIYSTMPIGNGNTEVQRLMADAGTAVNMTYGCSGSGAFMNDIDNAFTNNFGYTSATYCNTWNSTGHVNLQNDINAGRPIILGGCHTKVSHWKGLWYTYEECHAWVCDGYYRMGNDCYSSIMYHMNWGWHESGSSNDYIGYYNYVNWNISAVGMNFQYAKDYVHNIKP
jgi:hypothetical protein